MKNQKNHIFTIFLPLISLVLMAPICNKGSKVQEMQLSSSSFKHESNIPTVHTCEGANQSPPLAWAHVPPKTKSLSLIVDDPDAPHGTVVHWVAWNIDPKAQELQANFIAPAEGGLHQGINSSGKMGYMGPCPPSGSHRYYFKLYALDSDLNLPSTATKEDLLAAMKGHILGEAELMGRYQKVNN